MTGTTLRADEPLVACLICGAAVLARLAADHDQWHASVSSVAVETVRRVDRLEDR